MSRQFIKLPLKDIVMIEFSLNLDNLVYNIKLKLSANNKEILVLKFELKPSHLIIMTVLMNAELEKAELLNYLQLLG